jgi:uncharacterized protein (DUF983 family)
MPDADDAVASTLSRSAFEAVKRGALGRCPRCGTSKLFPKFFKPIAQCDACGQDWTPQQADDFPAYVAIFVIGHLLAPLIIALVKDAGLSVGALMAIILPLAVIMMIALIQPSKGAIIAIQWWFSMHGFKRLSDKQD